MVPSSRFAGNPLLFPGNDEEGQHGDHRAVHGHRNRHLIERNPVEQDLHVLDAVDRDARLANIADHARVIAVIAAMGRKVEGHRQPLLPRREVAAIEGVDLFGGGETRILPDRPGSARIHRGAYPARERREARQAGIDGNVLTRVKRLDREPFRRLPGQVLPFHFLGRCGLPVGNGRFAHRCTIQAAALGRAETRACQARREARSSGIGRPTKPAKSTVVSSRISALVK